TRSAVNPAELLATESNHRRVNNGHHLFDVSVQQAVEQNLVRVLQRAEIDVTLEIIRFVAIRLIGAHRLLAQRFDLRRQQAMKTERGPLFVGERGAFVEDGCIEELRAAKAQMNRGSAHRILSPGPQCESRYTFEPLCPTRKSRSAP